MLKHACPTLSTLNPNSILLMSTQKQAKSLLIVLPKVTTNSWTWATKPIQIQLALQRCLYLWGWSEEIELIPPHIGQSASTGIGHYARLSHALCNSIMNSGLRQCRPWTYHAPSMERQWQLGVTQDFAIAVFSRTVLWLCVHRWWEDHFY